MDHFLSGLNAAAARCQTGFTPISDGTGNAFCIDPAVLSTLEYEAGNVLVKTQKKRARMHGLGMDDSTNTLIKLGALGIAGYIAWKWLKGGRKR